MKEYIENALDQQTLDEMQVLDRVSKLHIPIWLYMLFKYRTLSIGSFLKVCGQNFLQRWFLQVASGM